MRVLVAPDSFKGSLSAGRAAAALAAGWRGARPADEVREMPVADGGEGTLEALVGAWNGRFEVREVAGPLGEPVRARFGLSADGRVAVVETAEASGFLLVPRSERDPKRTTTYGTGQLIRAALDAGARRIVVAVGGSGTNDAGSGMAEALGARLLDAAGNPVPRGGEALALVADVDVSGLDPRLADVEVIAAADVDNPLTGPEGASAVFGPQKGASAADVALLDDALARFAAAVEVAFGVEPGTWRDAPGAGAAGGLGFGLLAFCRANIRSGAEVVLDAIGLDEGLAWADLIITGEGRLDGQSAYGKVPVAVARRARKFGKPTVAVAAVLGPGWETLQEHGIGAALSIAPGPIDVETSVRRAEPLLRACGHRLARLVEIGVQVGNEGLGGVQKQRSGPEGSGRSRRTAT